MAFVDISPPIYVSIPKNNGMTVEMPRHPGAVVPIPSGAQGLPGEPGFSPVFSVEEITGGNRVTITDADGDTTFDVMNGAQGEQGEPGEGVVTKVKQARNFGRDAELDIDFKQTKSIDGTYVNTFIGEEAKEQMKSLAMAAGASLAGMIILGPIGVIGGAFVKGKNIDLPEGTEFYIQTKDDTTLYGVLTTAE